MDIKITEYNGLTKETIEREPTADEIAAFETRAAKYEALEIAKQEKANARADLLTRLGITEDEARLLLG
jgi:hypothetical protein